MKRMGLFVSVSLATVVAWSPAWAFRISSPAEGTQVEAGTTVRIVVDGSGAGFLTGVMFSASGRGMGGAYDVFPPYTWNLQIPRDFVGDLTIMAIGKVLGQKTGVAPEAEVTINVVLPANVQINAIRVDDDQRILFMEVEEKRKVYVYGQFSDGVEREVSSVNSGTQYEVADPRIASVDSEGLITVLVPGTTTIKIKNGNKQLQVEVRARPAE